jgi:hypothetical protein
MAWKSMQINVLHIVNKTDQAILFNCPHKSKYDGYSFWRPAKLVRDGKHSYAVKVSYTDDSELTLWKYGKKGNVLDEIKIGAPEFESMFAATNSSIRRPKQKKKKLINIPKQIDPVYEQPPIDELVYNKGAK